MQCKLKQKTEKDVNYSCALELVIFANCH